MKPPNAENAVVDLVLWKLLTEEREHVLKGLGDGWGGGFEALAYSPDSTRLAGSASDFRIFVWDPRTGKELRRSEGYAYDMAFSPDSRYLATAAVDQGKIKTSIPTHQVCRLHNRQQPVLTDTDQTASNPYDKRSCTELLHSQRDAQRRGVRIPPSPHSFGPLP